jgi:hypothetical protein
MAVTVHKAYTSAELPDLVFESDKPIHCVYSRDNQYSEVFYNTYLILTKEDADSVKQQLQAFDDELMAMFNKEYSDQVTEVGNTHDIDYRWYGLRDCIDQLHPEGHFTFTDNYDGKGNTKFEFTPKRSRLGGGFWRWCAVYKVYVDVSIKGEFELELDEACKKHPDIPRPVFMLKKYTMKLTYKHKKVKPHYF